MSEAFFNVYEDAARADAYAALEFPGTYYLAYRDLPAIIAGTVTGRRAVDFGCGTGRSTRFLQGLGFETVGLDISEQMLAQARRRDPSGDYRLVSEGGASGLTPGSQDLVLAAFTFDNIPTLEKKVAHFHALGGLLGPGGRIVAVVSAPEIYWHEWASFSTRDFPENRTARSGDPVRIVMLDVPDRRPVEDVLCTDATYREAFRQAGLEALEVHRPLGLPTEPMAWVSETTIAPWTVYVLGHDPRPPRR
jgi:trans-aconitate methyltransferase